MHNFPGLPVGEFAIRPGAGDGVDRHHRDRDRRQGRSRGAAASRASIRCWWARRSSLSCSRSWRATSIRWMPPWCRSACSRRGHTDNVIPQHALLRGTARSLSAEVRESACATRVREVVEGTARLYGAKAELTYTTGYPVVGEQARAETEFAAAVAREIAGKDKVDTDMPPRDGRGRLCLHAAASGPAPSSSRQRRQRRAASPGL